MVFPAPEGRPRPPRTRLDRERDVGQNRLPLPVRETHRVEGDLLLEAGEGHCGSIGSSISMGASRNSKIRSAPTKPGWMRAGNLARYFTG